MYFWWKTILCINPYYRKRRFRLQICIYLIPLESWDCQLSIGAILTFCRLIEMHFVTDPKICKIWQKNQQNWYRVKSILVHKRCAKCWLKLGSLFHFNMHILFNTDLIKICTKTKISMNIPNSLYINCSLVWVDA